MADIATRAYQALTPADLASGQRSRRFQTAVFNLIRSELTAIGPKTAPPISAADYQNLNTTLINPMETFYANAANDGLHWHLAPPHQGVTVLQWPKKVSYPMFNIYDVLAVVHTILAKKYGFIPLDARPDKRTDRPVPFKEIPRADQQGLGPQHIIQILESVRICCIAFAQPKATNRPRWSGLPAMVGYSVPSSPGADFPYPTFGVVAGGSTAEKAEIINARKVRFSQAVQAVPNVEIWVCGNCAEQAYWPLPGDEKTTYDGMTVYTRAREGEEALAGTLAINSGNCRAMAVQLRNEGFEMKDRSNLRG
jgi:hypothetical protein